MLNELEKVGLLDVYGSFISMPEFDELILLNNCKMGTGMKWCTNVYWLLQPYIPFEYDLDVYKNGFNKRIGLFC